MVSLKIERLEVSPGAYRSVSTVRVLMALQHVSGMRVVRFLITL